MSEESVKSTPYSKHGQRLTKFYFTKIKYCILKFFPRTHRRRRRRETVVALHIHNEVSQSLILNHVHSLFHSAAAAADRVLYVVVRVCVRVCACT